MVRLFCHFATGFPALVIRCGIVICVNRFILIAEG